MSDSHLDNLYDLPDDVKDVMGLQALRPSAAVCKVMTIPNSNCVRIVLVFIRKYMVLHLSDSDTG